MFNGGEEHMYNWKLSIRTVDSKVYQLHRRMTARLPVEVRDFATNQLTKPDTKKINLV